MDLDFDKALFMATHNSYEKKPMGIVQSLDHGVRLLEFDIRLYNFESEQEYCLGHDYCKDVDTSNGTLGNPSTHFLNAWLQQVRSWSIGHPDHAPITIFFDLKDDLSSGAKKFAQGGLSNLQHTMQGIFGDSLYWRSSKPADRWPSVQSLRGRVLVVLSGSQSSRVAYQQDTGSEPQVAINEAGFVMEAHENSGGTSVYYWTGKADGDAISWSRHGNIDFGAKAWPVLGNDNTVVVLYKSSWWDTLYYRVGTLDPATQEIALGAYQRYDSGVSPTGRIYADGRLEERHKIKSTGKVWVRNGTIDAASSRINWDANAVQQDLPLFDSGVAQSSSGSRRVEVREKDGLVECRVDAGQAFEKISYPQMFFVDWQPGCGGGGEDFAPLNNQDAFLGVSNTWCSNPLRIDGVATRVWGYSLSDAQSGKEPGSFPATDEPGDEFKAWVLSKPNGIAY